MKPILHLCLLSMLLSTCPTHGYAQRWLKPFHKTSKKVFPQQTLAASCVFPFTKQEIKNAARQAEQMWQLQQINAALDKKVLADWALQQSVRIQSHAYHKEAQHLAFIRHHAQRMQATLKRDFVHINAVNYTPFIKDKNKILVAADWNPGSQLQIAKLLETIRKQNPQNKIIVASPFIPPSARPYASGQYSRFFKDNGADLFFKQLLRQPHMVLVNLKTEENLSVKNHWKNWLEAIEPLYPQPVLGKNKDILIIIAPTRFIEGNAAQLKQEWQNRLFWNQDKMLTLSIRTQKESNLTDFKWEIITSRGKTPIPAPYINGWLLNAFVDRVDPQFSTVLGTDVIVRVHPQLPPRRPRQE